MARHTLNIIGEEIRGELYDGIVFGIDNNRSIRLLPNNRDSIPDIRWRIQNIAAGCSWMKT